MSMMSSSSSSKNIVTVRCSDNEIFELDKAVALQNETIKNKIKNSCPYNVILLSNVDSKIFAKVIEYGKKHTITNNKDVLKKWDLEFIMYVDRVTLLDLAVAAHNLGNKRLLDLTCQAVAEKIKGMTPGQIRDFFSK